MPPLKLRELRKRLKKHDKRFKFDKSKGKGSHETIIHPDIDGQPASFPVKNHGDGTEVRKGSIGAIERRFKLPKDLLK